MFGNSDGELSPGMILTKAKKIYKALLSNLLASRTFGGRVRDTIEGKNTYFYKDFTIHFVNFASAYLWMPK